MNQLLQCFVYSLLAQSHLILAASSKLSLRLIDAKQFPYEHETAYFGGENASSSNEAFHRKLATVDRTKNQMRVAVLMFAQSARSEYGKTCSPTSISKQKLFARNIAQVFSQIQACYNFDIVRTDLLNFCFLL